MSEGTGPFLPHGGYRKLRSYKVAEVVYDATVVFCRRFLSHDRRLTDQMVQAARSGVRNISEASGAAATSRKSEMKLTLRLLAPTVGSPWCDALQKQARKQASRFGAAPAILRARAIARFHPTSPTSAA